MDVEYDLNRRHSNVLEVYTPLSQVYGIRSTKIKVLNLTLMKMKKTLLVHIYIYLYIFGWILNSY